MHRNTPTAGLFFKKVQNKVHYAVHGHHDSELIIDRANAEKEHMDLTTWENAPDGKIVMPDVSIAQIITKRVSRRIWGAMSTHSFIWHRIWQIVIFL